MYGALEAVIATQQDAKTIHRGEYASGAMASNFATPYSTAELWAPSSRRYKFVVIGYAPEVIIKPIAKVDWVQDAKSKLNAFTKLQPNWNGRGSEPPSKEALEKSMQILLAFHRQAKEPSRIAPSSNDGVIFYIFGDDGRRGDIEVSNTGDIVATIKADTNRPAEVFDVAAEDSEIEETIQRIQAALGLRMDL
jgi:hypothetical protein